MIFDFSEFMRKVIKYLILGMCVSVVSALLPKKSMNIEEIVVIGITASAIFAILDVFAPSIGVAARSGAGFSIGAGIVGGIPLR
jgi:hypothetical protein